MANSKTSLNGYEYGRSPKTTTPFWGESGEGASIDDTGVYTDKTWSSKKISDELAEKAEASDLVNYAKVTSVYNKSESYSKAEVDALIDEIPSVDAYTKTQTDNLLANKANVTDVYTKTETDSLLANKAGLNAVYTKGQTDRLLSDKANVADVYTKAQTNGLLADKADVTDLADYAKVTSVYAKSETYTKTEVDNLIAGAGGGEVGVKRFILKPYEISGIDLYGQSEALSHISYTFGVWAKDSQNVTKLIYPLIMTKGDGSTVKFEISSDVLFPWNENDTNSEYPKADAVYRKFSVGGMDLGVCFTGNHIINNMYFPDVVIAADASLDIASIAINITDYNIMTFVMINPYDNIPPEALFRDYNCYPRKDEVWEKDESRLVRYQAHLGMQYYQSSDNTWHSCLYEINNNELSINNNYKGSTLAFSQFGNQVEFVFNLKSGVSFTANQKVKIGWCTRKPIGANGIKINGFVYNDSSYQNIEGASCVICKNADIYLVFNSNYTTTGDEIIRFSYFTNVVS